MIVSTPYDRIGRGYGRRRQPDARLRARIHAALADARSVLNVGAGTGSYEPVQGMTVALEPSSVMIAQRPPGAPPAVKARAEALPFATRSIDAIMGVLTLHHWHDLRAGLAECVRVARERVVLFTWDPASEGFWLVRDYLPEFFAMDRTQFPSMEALTAALAPSFEVTVTRVPIPHDCSDGFLGAFWRRPDAYLAPEVQASISSFARNGSAAERLERLRGDLASGAWHSRYRHLLDQDELDVGYRLVVAERSRPRA